jgi:hypothetical protein
MQPPNAWVSRATAKQPASWARAAEQPAPSQAQNAAAVASAAPFVGQVRARPLLCATFTRREYPTHQWRYVLDKARCFNISTDSAGLAGKETTLRLLLRSCCLRSAYMALKSNAYFSACACLTARTSATIVSCHMSQLSISSCGEQITGGS